SAPLPLLSLSSDRRAQLPAAGRVRSCSGCTASSGRRQWGRMARPVAKLAIEEIRQRFVRADHLVSARLLSQLRRDPRQGVRKIYAMVKQRYERERGERLRLDAMLNFERVLWQSGVRHIAGVDEVGVGPLAGPVVAAAVVFLPDTEIAGIDDSKRLDADTRVRLAAEI